METNLAELVDAVYYDKVELDCDYDYNDTTVKVMTQKLVG